MSEQKYETDDRDMRPSGRALNSVTIPNTARQLDRIDAGLEDLTNHISQLESKLSPILLPEQDSMAKAAMDTSPEMSDIARRLESLADTLGRRVEDLHTIFNRVDL